MRKAVLFQTIQFSISTEFSLIWPIDRIPWCATPLGHSGTGSNGNKGVIWIPPNSSITGTAPSDCLVSYTGHSRGTLTLCDKIKDILWVCKYTQRVCIHIYIYIYIYRERERERERERKVDTKRDKREGHVEEGRGYRGNRDRVG